MIGVVTGLIGDGFAKVKLKSAESCEGCSGCAGGCSRHLPEVMAKNSVGAVMGDEVEIESCGRLQLLFSFLLFVCPIIIYAVSFWLISLSLELYAAALLAFLPAAAWFAVLKVLNDHFSKRSMCVNTVVKIQRPAGRE